MKRAQRVAEKAHGVCSPNPFVGAVIVKKGVVISEGWTQEYGSDHAEIQALKKAGAKARGADLYVTLEPCSHYGKTPPCTKAIIAAGIKRVFLGITDPNPLVNGKGILQLQEAGIDVVQGIMETAITKQLECYLCRVQKQRPFVTWKVALSLDGKYSAEDGSSRWISGEKSRAYVHRLRSQTDVVLTGIGTVLGDDPMLNARLRNKCKQPLRAVLDTKLKLPETSQIALTARTYPTAVFCAKGCEKTQKAVKLREMGITIHPVKAVGDNLDLREVLNILHQQGCYSILLECGSKLASSFFAEELVDKCHFFYGAKILGGSKSVLSELAISTISSAIHLRDVSYKRFDEDLLISGYPVFP